MVYRLLHQIESSQQSIIVIQKEAFEKEYTPSAVEENIEIIKDLDLYDLDDNNTLYFGITKNNDLIACTMHKKNDKYFYSGFYELFDLNKYKEGFYQ